MLKSEIKQEEQMANPMYSLKKGQSIQNRLSNRCFIFDMDSSYWIAKSESKKFPGKERFKTRGSKPKAQNPKLKTWGLETNDQSQVSKYLTPTPWLKTRSLEHQSENLRLYKRSLKTEAENLMPKTWSLKPEA